MLFYKCLAMTAVLLFCVCLMLAVAAATVPVPVTVLHLLFPHPNLIFFPFPQELQQPSHGGCKQMAPL